MPSTPLNSPTTPFTVEPYRALATIYNRAHMAAYSLEIVPRLLELAFLEDWLGRVILEIGCGTGEAACWLTERSYRVIGVDQSQAMLNVAQNTARDRGLAVEWIASDVRRYKPDLQVDLVLALGGTFNQIGALQDLDTVIQMVYDALDFGKLFIFDLDTLHGLVKQGDFSTVVFDDVNALISSENTLNYETLARTTHYRIMLAVDRDTPGGLWRRADETHHLRGFPIPAVVRALTRVGFQVLKTLDTNLELVDPNTVSRVIIVAQKPNS